MKKLLTLIAMLTIFAISTVTAQDTPKTEETKKEEPKKAEFPGKAGLEFKQTFQGAAVGNKVSDTEKSESAVYSKTEFKAKLDVPFFDGFYTFTPWIKDRIDVYYNPSVTDYTNVNVNSKDIPDLSKTDKSDSKITGRNRAEFGFSNKIGIKDVLNITLDPAFRFEYNINQNVKDEINKGSVNGAADSTFDVGPAAKLVFMPSLNLDSKYKFGFEFKLVNTLFMHMYPIMDQVDSSSVLNKYEYEGTWDFSFDVLRPLNIDKTYSFKIFLKEYVDLNVVTNNYLKKFTIDGDDYYTRGDFKEQFNAGISGGISDVSVFACYDLVVKFNIDDCPDLKHNVWNGFQIGASFKKSTWEIGMTYAGQIQTWISTLNDDKDGFENRKVEDNDLKKWESTIEAYFKASI